MTKLDHLPVLQTPLEQQTYGEMSDAFPQITGVLLSIAWILQNVRAHMRSFDPFARKTVNPRHCVLVSLHFHHKLVALFIPHQIDKEPKTK